MPQAAAAWAFSAVFGATTAAGAGVVALATAAAGIAFIGTAAALSYGLAAVSAALAGRPKVGGAPQRRDIVVKTTTGPRPIIYGEVTVGGTLVFIGTTGLENQYLDFVIAIAGHQVEAITDVWVDDELIANAQIGSGAAIGGAVSGNGAYRPRDGRPVMWIHKFLGEWHQVWSQALIDGGGSGYGVWSGNHRLRGCAYVHIRCVRHSKAYASGPPQGFRFRVKGARVYDPRLDSTNGGSGPHRLNDATTWTFSRNPALATADYITGGTVVNDLPTPIRRRGFGALPTYVEWPSVIAAANVCDESVSTPSGPEARYLCDGVVYPSDESPDADCLEAILTSMLGQVVYTGGRYKVHAGAYEVPIYTLTEADLAGELSYVTGQGRAERYNVVRGTRFDQVQGGEVEFLSRTDGSYQTADSGALYRDIELPMTVDEYRAQRIAQLILRRSREQRTLTWPGQLSCAKIAVWDTVRVTCGELGLSNHVFRCIERRTRFGAGDAEPIVELTLREEFAATYADPLLTDYGTPSVAVDPGPTPDMLDPVLSMSITSTPLGLHFRWVPGALPIPLGVHFEIWRGVLPTFDGAIRAWTGSGTECFIPTELVSAYYYWIRPVRGEAVGATYPATTGLLGTSQSYHQILQAPVSDPTFSLATDQTHWTWPYTEASIIPNGGAAGVNGALRIVADASASGGEIRSVRTPLLKVVKDQKFRMSVRYRRRSVLGVLAYANDQFTFGGSLRDQGRGTTRAMTGNTVVSNLNLLEQDRWYESSAELTVPDTVIYFGGYQTWVMWADFFVYVGNYASGTVEFDTIDVTAI